MKLVFIYGKPATGKLTVARELAALTGYKLFHNQMTVDLLLPVFEFGSPSFVELREQIWLSVIEQAARARLSGLIFNFAPETTVRKNFIDRVIDVVAGAGSRVHFVELTCPMDEVYRRIDSKSRRKTGKLTSHEDYKKLEAAGVFSTAHMPKADLTVDTSQLQPAEAAEAILKGLRLPRATA
ncbi:AAA family ATPase [Ferrovibrio sp.]|uniref:AAA family ATPase n=1 Tax=Ferrovibrio sp. TaxID=1917215 RepID=UPI00261EEAEE|nr:AAA family ATPase [Ferrovibrio sp.]